MRMRALILVTAITVPIGAGAKAAVVDPSFNTLMVATCDDCSSAETPLGFAANFFGTTYTTTFVNNNGNLTFGSSQGTFTPTGLTGSYHGLPIIAPFFADVDTRGTGSVTYGVGIYNGLQAFGATYNNVGYYSGGTDKTNDFQVILTNRADTGVGNFDIYFNYDQVQFETGSASGGVDGLGGISAAVGYSAGSGADGTYGQLQGSLVNGALIDGGPDALVSHTNNGVLGQYEFSVRNGAVIASGVPEPGTWAMMLLGFGGLAMFAYRRHTADRMPVEA